MHVHVDIFLCFFPDHFITSAPLQLRVDKVEIDKKRRLKKKKKNVREQEGSG